MSFLGSTFSKYSHLQDILAIDANDVSTLVVHVHGVVTDCNYALAGFLVSMLFGVSPGQS